jgi:hypothetical protein
MSVYKELIEAINNLPSMKVEPKKSDTTKNILDFFNVQEENDMWAGMRGLGHPISFYIGYGAGLLRERYGCAIPKEIPDNAVITSYDGGYCFAWMDHTNHWSEKIVL